MGKIGRPLSVLKAVQTISKAIAKAENELVKAKFNLLRLQNAAAASVDEADLNLADKLVLKLAKLIHVD